MAVQASLAGAVALVAAAQELVQAAQAAIYGAGLAALPELHLTVLALQLVVSLLTCALAQEQGQVVLAVQVAQAELVQVAQAVLVQAAVLRRVAQVLAVPAVPVALAQVVQAQAAHQRVAQAQVALRRARLAVLFRQSQGLTSWVVRSMPLQQAVQVTVRHHRQHAMRDW